MASPGLLVPYISVSTIIEAPVEVVWPLCHPAQFSKIYTELRNSCIVPQEGFGNDLIRWEFHDGHVMEFGIEQYSVLDHSITWNLYTSAHPLPYAASGSTIRVHPITHGMHQGHSFVQISGEYSSDIDHSILVAGKEKRYKTLQSLAEYIKQEKLA